jgi:DNA-binding winged helix-turn-helix (wHTH) protein
VPLGSRAFDLLHSLIRSAGSVISKEELVREVWPTTTVEESNLRFQMASLRKALGVHRDLIKTIPGRGYLFTGECTDAKAAKPLSYAGDQAESSPAVTVGPPITAAQLRALIGLIEQQIEALQAKEAHLPVKQAKI